MKNANIVKFGMILSTLVVASCSTSSSVSYETLKPVTIHSLKEGLVHMNQEKNFTLDVYANKQLYYSINYTDKYIGSDSKGAVYMNLFVDDGEGIFKLSSTNDILVSGEYIEDESGFRYKDLYKSGLFPVLYDVATSYVFDLDETQNEVEISSKAWKIAFIEAIGFTKSSYVSLDYLRASYNDATHTISFECSFNKSLYVYKVVANNFGSTKNAHYREFMSKGGTVYKPSEQLIKMRNLLKTDNFARLTYDFDSESYLNMEVFHPNYFYTQYFGSNTLYGYMAIDHKVDQNEPEIPALFGCYFFQIDQSGMPHFNSTPIYDKPIIQDFFHYPKYLSLLKNLQYMVKGSHKDVKNYSRSSDKYIVYDMNTIKDFAHNFSLDQTWSFDQVPPYALAIELELDAESDSEKIITFHYLMSYQGQKLDYTIPICNFGLSANSTLDLIYDMYNN